MPGQPTRPSTGINSTTIVRISTRLETMARVGQKSRKAFRKLRSCVLSGKIPKNAACSTPALKLEFMSLSTMGQIGVHCSSIFRPHQSMTWWSKMTISCSPRMDGRSGSLMMFRRCDNSAMSFPSKMPIFTRHPLLIACTTWRIHPSPCWWGRIRHPAR